MSTFGERLNAARRLRRLSQTELARKARLQQTAISFFETGRRSPSFGNLKRLTEALNVTCDYLLGRCDFPEIPLEAVSKLFRGERKLSSKDVKFLQRTAENLIRRKKCHHQLCDRRER